MRLFLVKDELRCYWVGAPSSETALTEVRRYLTEWEDCDPAEVVEALGDGVEVVDGILEDVPQTVQRLFNRHQRRTVYATQWQDSPLEILDLRRY